MKTISKQQQLTAEAVIALALATTDLEPVQLFLLATGLIETMHLLPEITDIKSWNIILNRSVPTGLRFDDKTVITFN